MQNELSAVLSTLMRSRALSERFGPLVQALLLAQLLAGAAHDGPPHAARRAPGRAATVPRGRVSRRGSVAGRRPRG